MTSVIRHNSTLSTPPSNLTPVQAQVVQALAAGRSVSAAAREAQLHRSTIHNWLKDQPSFAAAVKIARESYRLELGDDLLDLAGDALNTLRSLISSPDTPPAVRLRAALAALERPTYPDPTWNLPLRVEPPEAQRVVDGIKVVRAEAQLDAAISRSAPCPCGSGQKYKRCCGRDAPPILNG
jgi:hypothetical protein